MIIQRYFNCIYSSILNVDKLWWWCKWNMGMKWIYLIIYHNFSSSKIINLVSNSFVDHLRTWITHVGISTMSNMISFLICTQSNETVVWSLYLKHIITFFRDKIFVKVVCIVYLRLLFQSKYQAQCFYCTYTKGYIQFKMERLQHISFSMLLTSKITRQYYSIQ